MANRGPAMYNLEPYFAAGIDPKTGLPVKMGGTSCGIDKLDIKKQLRIVDEQNAVNRFTWYNLPDGLTSHLLERILYYKGQGMFFKMPTNDKFYFLPYALDGTIDVYGRFTSVTPLPFNGSTTDKKQEPLIKGLSFDCVYEVQLPEEFIDKDGNVKMEELRRTVDKSCVLLKDYTEQISQTVLSRQILNDPLLDMMSECMPLMRTALFNSTGVSGMRVGDQSEQSNVEAANMSVNNAALTGKRYVPVVGQIDFQELAGGNVAKSEEFLLALQSLDNYRLSLYGLDNGGLFQKKSHMLEAEQEMNTGNVGLVLKDSLENRQDFCNIVNSIWGLGIWCEVSETALGIDRNMDGQIGSNESENTNQVSSRKEEIANDDE